MTPRAIEHTASPCLACDLDEAGADELFGTDYLPDEDPDPMGDY